MFLINIELWVHELVIIETGHIDARFKYEVKKILYVFPVASVLDTCPAHLYSLILSYCVHIWWQMQI